MMTTYETSMGRRPRPTDRRCGAAPPNSPEGTSTGSAAAAASGHLALELRGQHLLEQGLRLVSSASATVGVDAAQHGGRLTGRLVVAGDGDAGARLSSS